MAAHTTVEPVIQGLGFSVHLNADLQHSLNCLPFFFQYSLLVQDLNRVQNPSISYAKIRPGQKRKVFKCRCRSTLRVPRPTSLSYATAAIRTGIVATACPGG